MTALDAALIAGRAEAEALMRDTIIMYRPVEGVLDRETGAVSSGPPAVVFYTGKARVKPAQISGNEVQAGEQELLLNQYRISLPFSTPLPAGQRPEPGDVIDVTESEDPRMAGLRLWVKRHSYLSTATAWRIVAEDREVGAR